jgi:UDP-N-acetylglucosamine acyltransferase
MGTYLPQDLPPYVTAAGNTAKPYGLNSEGLKRRGFSAPTLNRLKTAYRTLYRAGLSLEDARRELESQALECPEVRPICDFLARSKRGIVR